MNRNDILALLFEMRDEKYAAFQAKLIPTYPSDKIIGVRTPLLRTLAKKLYKNEETEDFLSFFPHEYFEENQLHAFIISLEKDFDKCMTEVENFLPMTDNWATCDQLSPNIFKKHTDSLLPYIRKWLTSRHTYTVRFAIGMLMRYYLDEKFSNEYPRMVAEISSEEYYINMMRAWYFATALAKQYQSVIPYIEEKRLDLFTHNKAIQKSVESFRITDEQKQYLKTLKRR